MRDGPEFYGDGCEGCEEGVAVAQWAACYPIDDLIHRAMIGWRWQLEVDWRQSFDEGNERGPAFPLAILCEILRHGHAQQK